MRMDRPLPGPTWLVMPWNAVGVDDDGQLLGVVSEADRSPTASHPTRATPTRAAVSEPSSRTSCGPMSSSRTRRRGWPT